MQKFELFDETFDPFRTESYELSIQVSLNGFSFCIKDTTRNQFIALAHKEFEQPVVFAEDWNDRAECIFNGYDWLKKPFKRVVLNFESPRFTITPKEFFEFSKAKQLLTIAHQLSDLEEVNYHPVENTVCVFSSPTALIASLSRIHKNFKLVSSASAPLSLHLSKSKARSTPLITLSVYNDFCVLILANDKKLLHCGSIKYINHEDTIYHMVNTCKQFGITPADIEITLIGDMIEKDSFISLLNRFFKSAKQENSLKHSHFSYQLSQHKASYANLFNLSLCE